MPSIYPKSTKELFKEFVHSFTPPTIEGFGLVERKPLLEGGHFTRKEILSWFQEKYPKIKQATVNAHLILMSTNAPSRVHYNVRPNGADDLLFQTDPSNFRLYVKDSDPPPIYKQDLEAGTAGDTDNDDEERGETHEFAYEKDLRNFLVNNMWVIRPSLCVYRDGDINGVEFPVGERYVDILAMENQSDLVVIELKVSKGYDRAVGQLLRYMGWIQQNLAEPGQKVKGMIIARTISEDLRLATSQVNDVELFEYKLAISLKKIDK
jgi:endonuclease